MTETKMNFAAAVRAAAPDAPDAAISGLEEVQEQMAKLGAMDTPERMAHLIGQCAHESMRFTRVAESLYFTTASRIRAVWPSRFPTVAVASQYTRSTEKLANKVYGGRMGNTEPGDGFRYRGRGYLQLTGRSNYRTFGNRIGVDLEGKPELAEEPTTAWLIAASYLSSRKRSGKTAFQWADENNVEMVTRIINGGTHGLSDRRNRTHLALAALAGKTTPTGKSSKSGMPTLKKGTEGDEVEILQHALAAKGFPVGAVDGDFGKRTLAAVKAFQESVGLKADGVVGAKTWRALGTLPA